MIEPIKPGALARVIVDTVNLTSDGTGELFQDVPKGSEFTVEEYVSDAESEDNTAFYWGSWRGGVNNLAVTAFKVEQVKSAEEMRARKLPRPDELLETIASALIHADEVYETEQEKADLAVTAYGRSENGLTYGFRVKLDGYWRTDD